MTTLTEDHRYFSMLKYIIVLLVVCFSCCCVASNNGVARTPPMGWNSWNHFGCDTAQITEDLFKEIAQAMVSSGMKAAGYEYINLDDCWLASTRDSTGKLQPDPKRFPDGIPALAEYVHSLGLKFGIYEDTGNKTCGGFPGSEGYYAVDAQTYAEWGVDYVKLDGCYTDVSDMKAIYTQNSMLFNQTGRPMVFSCRREWYDVRDSWWSWTEILDFQEIANLSLYAGPGNWNISFFTSPTPVFFTFFFFDYPYDPDMLEIGNGNQTDTEYRSLFSLWSMIAAPLIAGNDLRNMSQATIEILTAPEVIAVDQDPLGKQGKRVVKNGESEVWARELSGGAIAVALFNRGPDTAAITANWADIGLSPSVKADVRDLWLREDVGTFTGSYSAKVDSHATILVKLTPSN